MPYVRGFLRIGRRGSAGQLPSPGEPAPPEEPDGGVDEVWPAPGYPTHPIELPDPPPGIFPPPTIANPIVPIPPTVNPPPPVGEIWPPFEGAPSGKFAILVIVPGHGVRYVVVDPSLKPTPVK